ncbi:outer membrane beta-barrel family protein [Pedobacter sp. Hv1]|uniref:outer membrane beta-barrel family protein n=1 Tax=Pedobacter sp. Hv1 TaxID=1740090 RepID=UPI0006D88F51|nr:outer membrane beta-barrel family protein [Pedobacter sp. Hv1]KQC00912.1 hypothetical protein AQF98_09570 [Pedobacter sp. Hv1]
MLHTTIRSILLASFLFISFIVQAQTKPAPGKIIGKLVDEKNVPIPFATLSLYLQKDTTLIKGTLTSETGDFSFENLPFGTYAIKIEVLGYEQSVTNMIVIDEQKPQFTLAQIMLHIQVQQLREISITRKKPLIERKSDKTILNVGNSILATGNSALDILAKAPGVTIDNSGDISLRGKSSVSVMINGKLTYLSSAQLITLLRNTNGNTIETIELINNPSAKYDAAGSGGMINIKLKKNQNYGTNVNLLLGAGYGQHYKSNGGINFNHRNKKLNVFGSYDYTNDKNFEDLNLKRSDRSETETTYFNQEGRDINTSKNNTYKIGLDYELNDKNTIGFTFNGYHNNNKSNSKINTLIGAQELQHDSAIVASNLGKSKYNNQTYNLNYKSVIDTLGQELNADLDYAKFDNINQINYNNYFFKANGSGYKPPLIFRTATPAAVKIWSGKIDYTYPFSTQTKLETGVKNSYVNTNNNFRHENLIDQQWVNDANRQNAFNYKETITAAYANLTHKFKALTLQVGLRTELTNSEGYSPITESRVKRNYIDFFPNVSLSKTVGEDHEFGLSYSKRVDRPDYQSLNPFVYFADLYTFSQGNPYLNPQYTNAFEFTYSFMEKISGSLGYSHTRDVITTTLINDPVKKTLMILEQNLASQNTYNLNIGAPIAINKWWNTTNDATLYYTDFKSPNLMGAPFSSGKLSYILNSTQTFSVSKSINAELSMDYQSAQVYGTYAVKPLYGIDFGVSKSFANKKATLKLAANDVFNLRAAKISSALPLQDYRLYQKEESRVFRLSFSYNFGSSSIKAARERSKSSDSEQSRVKSKN